MIRQLVAVGYRLIDSLADSLIPRVLNIVLTAGLGLMAVAFSNLVAHDPPQQWFVISCTVALAFMGATLVYGIAYGFFFISHVDREFLIHAKAAAYRSQLYCFAAAQASRIVPDAALGGVAGAAALLSFCTPGVTFYSPPVIFLLNLIHGAILTVVLTSLFVSLPIGLFQWYQLGSGQHGVIFWIWPLLIGLGASPIGFHGLRLVTGNAWAAGAGFAAWLWSWTEEGRELRIAFRMPVENAIIYADRHRLVKDEGNY